MGAGSGDRRIRFTTEAQRTEGGGKLVDSGKEHFIKALFLIFLCVLRVLCGDACSFFTSPA